MSTLRGGLWATLALLSLLLATPALAEKRPSGAAGPAVGRRAW